MILILFYVVSINAIEYLNAQKKISKAKGDFINGVPNEFLIMVKFFSYFSNF